jgi:hypothetical protein
LVAWLSIYFNPFRPAISSADEGKGFSNANPGRLKSVPLRVKGANAIKLPDSLFS